MEKTPVGVVVEGAEAGIVGAVVANEARAVVVARRRGVVAAAAGRGRDIDFNKIFPTSLGEV